MGLEESEDEVGLREQPGASLQSEDLEGEDIEVRKHKLGRQPLLPTKAEVDEHYPLHLHYRSWCRHCVAGKARSNQHATKDKNEERLGITWNADYAFMGGEYDEVEQGMQASLIMYDDDREFLGDWR